MGRSTAEIAALVTIVGALIGVALWLNNLSHEVTAARELMKEVQEAVSELTERSYEQSTLTDEQKENLVALNRLLLEIRKTQESLANQPGGGQGGMVDLLSQCFNTVQACIGVDQVRDAGSVGP